MTRQVDANHPIHDLLRQRWSPRAFADQAVATDQLCSLLEAARWAPSSYNEQPWFFLVATKDDPTEFARLLGCFVEFNQQWAKTAPVLMISVASTKFSRNGKPNRHGYHDVGLAVENLVVQGMALGIYTHQMAGIDVEKIRQTYGIPDGFDPVAGIAVGYPGDPGALADELRQRELTPSPRKAMQEFVYAGKWGQTAPWVK